MADILFSCECGMTLKVNEDEALEGKVTCPSCNASVRVPSLRKAATTPPGSSLENEPEPEPEPGSEGHQNFAIIYITLVSLLTVGAVGFFLIPALRGPKENAPDRILATDSRDETPGNTNSSRRIPAPTDTDSTAPLPRYTDAVIEPTPVVPSTLPAGPSAPVTPAPPEEIVEKSPLRAPEILPPAPAPTAAPDPPVQVAPVGPVPKANPKPKPRPVIPLSPVAAKLASAQRLEYEGDKDRAVAAYQAVIDQFPTTMESGIAKNRLRVLKPPPAKPKPAAPLGGIVPRG